MFRDSNVPGPGLAGLRNLLVLLFCWATISGCLGADDYDEGLGEVTASDGKVPQGSLADMGVVSQVDSGSDPGEEDGSDPAAEDAESDAGDGTVDQAGGEDSSSQHAGSHGTDEDIDQDHDSDGNGDHDSTGDDTGDDGWQLTWIPDGVTATRGHEGDSGVVMRNCPDGELMVGVEGHQLAMIRELVPVCAAAAYRPGAQYLDTQDAHTLEAVGINQGERFVRRCPDDHVMVGFEGRAAVVIDFFAVQCARLQVVAAASGPKLESEQVLVLEGVGGPGGVGFAATACQASAGASGLVVSHDEISINSLALACTLGDFR